MSAITVRRVPIPVLEFIPALIVAMVVFGVFTLWEQTYLAIVGWSSEGAYLYYCLTRLANHNGRPMHVPIPWRTPRTPIEPAPEPRTPRAWPPADGQCFVCGAFDEERQRVFGDATHPTCKEWLGDWNAPINIPGVVHVSGITFEDAIKAYRRAVAEPNRTPIVLPPPPDVRPLSIPNFQPSFTCKCPVCENRRAGLRSWSSGHPSMCLCSGCEAVRVDHERNGPHHRNCLCHGGLYCVQNPFNDDTPHGYRIHDGWTEPIPPTELPPFTPDPTLTRRSEE